MVFWIILALIAAAIVFYFIWGSHYRDDIGETVGTILAIVFVGVLIGGVICGFGALNQSPGKYEKQSTYGLRALVTKAANESSVSGSFFLGFGNVSGSSKEVTSIAYIETAKDGGSTLERIDVSDAVIYEDSRIPRVEEWVQKIHNNKIFVPWDYTIDSYKDSMEYRFHIPKGTILDHYEVSQ